MESMEDGAPPPKEETYQLFEGNFVTERNGLTGTVFAERRKKQSKDTKSSGR
jgi:hypothetical protein